MGGVAAQKSFQGLAVLVVLEEVGVLEALSEADSAGKEERDYIFFYFLYRRILCVPQVIDRGAETVARGAARCASHVLDRGAQGGALGA